MNARAILAQTSESQTRMLIALTAEEVGCVLGALRSWADTDDPEMAEDVEAIRAVVERIEAQVKGERT